MSLVSILGRVEAIQRKVRVINRSMNNITCKSNYMIGLTTGRIGSTPTFKRMGDVTINLSNSQPFFYTGRILVKLLFRNGDTT